MKDDKLNQAASNEATEKETKKQKSSFKIRRKKKSEKEQKKGKKSRWVRLRILPIWLRIILIIFWLAFVIALGLMIGYGLIGDGSPMDVFKKETWMHIVDIYSGKE